MKNSSEQQVFEYTYSAAQQKEIETIRSKYLPKRPDKMQQLRALDAAVTQKACAVALSMGIVGTLTLGFGMSCIMVLTKEWFLPGIIIGMVGIACIIAAYPVYRRTVERLREKFAPQILHLTEELLQGK